MRVCSRSTDCLAELWTVLPVALHLILANVGFPIGGDEGRIIGKERQHQVKVLG
jgi:hypothetical protein